MTTSRNTLDIRALILLAVLLAAGFILNFTLGNAISAVTFGVIQPEFIIAAFCLMILVEKPTLLQSLVVGLIAAAVIQLTTKTPFVDFAAEGIAAVLMGAIVRATAESRFKALVPFASSLVTTIVSGTIFMLIKIALIGFDFSLTTLMLPVIVLTAVFNALLVSALYVPISKALGAMKRS